MKLLDFIMKRNSAGLCIMFTVTDISVMSNKHDHIKRFAFVSAVFQIQCSIAKWTKNKRIQENSSLLGGYTM